LISAGVLVLATLGLSERTASLSTNLLKNPGFEAGLSTPAGWSTFSPRPRGITYALDDAKHRSGKRSARVEGFGRGMGMWQQVIDVQPDRVYVFTGHVAFEDIAPPGECRLQLVFRDADNQVIEFVNFPAHTGTREFALDFPPKLKVRAPDGAARVEVNLYLSGTGKAWFDDVFFGLAPTGEVSGMVTSGGKPLQDARVYVWGDPWGKTHEAITDSAGRYRLTGIPVAFPRYVLMAAKDGYRTRPAGDIDVKEDGNTGVDFQLRQGGDPDDLRVKFGTLSLQELVPGVRIPDGAAIPPDADGYAEAIRPYLASDEYIQSDHPDVIAKAKQLVEALPAVDRNDTRKVAWVIYQWVCKHIDHDGVFSRRRAGGLEQPFQDVTSGIWQTLAPDGWCWGKSFLDWGYRPDELLKTECGICVEHAWLVSAMFRSLNIPARASVGSLEFWAQDADANGAWVHMSTTGGRSAFRERGELGPGRSFEGGPPHARYSVLSRPVLHEDWNAKNKGLWRERHPWGERYEGTPSGYEQAMADLKKFAATGEAPRAKRPHPQGASPGRRAPGRRTPRREQGAGEQHDLAVQRRPHRQPPGDTYQIHYSDVTINLLNMDGQQTLDVRFPLVTEPSGKRIKTDNTYWTNHRECIKRTWIEEITNPPARGTERWFHIEFDLAPLLDDAPASAAAKPVDVIGAGPKLDRPFEWVDGLLVRPSDFSVTRWAAPGDGSDRRGPGNFWWNMLSTPRAAHYQPTTYLKKRLAEWNGPREPIVTCLIHENNFYRARSTPWALVYYADIRKSRPLNAPFNLNAPDASVARSPADRQAIWRA